MRDRIRAGASFPPLSHPLRFAPPDLPMLWTPFIDYERELTLTLEHLSDPNCRLITLTGPASIGKTRLAWQIAAQAELFMDGVIWVSLVNLHNATELALAIAHALGLTFSNPQDVVGQLLHDLHNEPRELLVVLDHFEQLIPAGGAELVSKLLRATPRLTLLITSRERLNLQAELVLGL